MNYTDIERIPTLVQSLRTTFNSGLTKDLEFRKEQLRNLKRFFQENEKEILDAIYKDLRKHSLEAISSEIGPVLGDIDFMLKNLEKLSKPVSVQAHYKMNMLDNNKVKKEPKGLVLILGAWNYPVHLLLLPLVGAIAAGNCAVIKPSEISRHTSQFIADNLPNYINRQAFCIIVGGVEESNHLLRKFDHIFYTGSGHVGKIIMTAAAAHLTPVTLELGGKCPAIIASDADLSTAANRILWGKFYNAGQTCVSPDYVMVPKANLEQFIDICRNIIYDRYGEQPQESDSFPRIVNEGRFDALARPLDALDSNKILLGGQKDKKDLYISPTLVGPLDSDDPLFMQDEIFGPILPVVPVEDFDEAIRVINSKESPLAIYLFSDDKPTQKKVFENTSSGAILVNDTLMHVQESSLPFGGVGASGMGSYHGAKSFDTFSYERSIMIKYSGLESVMKARYPPYNSDKQALFVLLTIGLPDALSAKIKTLYYTLGSAYRVLFPKKVKNSKI
ncbi:Aldehyde dehydrogenase [Rhizopus stolonifer]|uniref:Aldehyde dehydrogenase n=1 Tax=Rhizopus stolonifer TaxID=4846 RepID=A0A367J571_RHIST|nr:Aldehyde dehydrogenase [Rhizopus stolonifer]